MKSLEYNHQTKNNAGLLVGFFVAGYPDQSSFLNIIKESDKNGIDIFEIGFPSNDPYVDGTTIKNAHAMVDKSRTTTIEYWRQIRKATTKPIWVMAYKKDFIDTKFYLNVAKEGLVNAIIIPDCTQDERKKLSLEVKTYGVDVLGFVNPEMQEHEWKFCFDNFSLVYLQLYTGPTGKSVDSEQYQDLFNYSRNYELTKCFAGFGIKTPEKAKFLIEKGFTGIIIGTAIIENLNISLEQLYTYVREIKTAIKVR